MMLPLTSNAHVKARMKQYKAYENSKGVEIAKTILNAKIKNRTALLERHGFNGQEFDFREEITGTKMEKSR